MSLRSQLLRLESLNRRLNRTKIDQGIQAMNVGSVQTQNVAGIESIPLVQEFFAEDNVARKAGQNVEGHLEAVELRELKGRDMNLSYSFDYGLVG